MTWLHAPRVIATPNRTMSTMSRASTLQTTGVGGTAARVHRGAAGQNGPAIVTLVTTGTDVWSVPVGTTLTDEQYQAYLAGQLCVNVHRDAHKDGEIRAQLRP
jgi:hypothetical protein